MAQIRQKQLCHHWYLRWGGSAIDDELRTDFYLTTKALIGVSISIRFLTVSGIEGVTTLLSKRNLLVELATTAIENFYNRRYSEELPENVELGEPGFALGSEPVFRFDGEAIWHDELLTEKDIPSLLAERISGLHTRN